MFTVAEAGELASAFIAAIARGKDPTATKEKLTFGEFIKDNYEPWVLENRKSGDATAYTIKYNFNFLFDTPLEEITIEQVDKWKSKAKKAGLKDSSVNRRLTSLKAALNWAVKRNIIEANPLGRLERLSEADSVSKVRYLTPSERTSLLAALDAREKEIRHGRDSHNKWLKDRGLPTMPEIKEGDFADHLKPLVLLSLSTGIRRGSLFSLEWRDVNFTDKTIMVRAAASKSGKQYYVPLNKLAFDTLSRWHRQSKYTSPDNLVFPSPQTGKRMDNCKKAWEAVLKKAKIEDFRWHDMRHDFASQLVMKGVDLNTVRELLGHADLKMTLRYAHLAPAEKLRAVELLD